MRLAMFIGNDLIDALAIESSFITLPGYLGHFVRLLKIKHRKFLAEVNREPDFLLFQPTCGADRLADRD